MQIYRIKKEDLYDWCSIPMDQLESHPDSKVELIIKESRKKTMELAGNMMADEVIKNNAEGKITKWVLGSGPEDQFSTFINRVNTERISLHNLYVFHMDYGLDWNSRVFPISNTYDSPEGRMNVRFYGKIDSDLNVPPGQRIWPRLANLDYVDDKIEEMGGLDTVWAGVGYKGLVSMCESPHSPYLRITEEDYRNMKTKVAQINTDTIVASSQRVFGGCYDKISHQLVTIGFKSMLNTKRAVMMIPTGEWKQTVLRVLMFSDATIEYPVTLFPKYVPKVIVLTDKNTASHVMSRGEIVLSGENMGGKTSD